MAVGTAPPGGRLSRFATATVAAAQAWGRVLTTSAGVAALAGAAQLGVAYGLQLVRFRREFSTAGLWASQLTWTAWIAILAVVAGATGGVWTARRLAGDYGPVGRMELGERIAVALAAGLGASVTVVLTALPARQAGLAGSDPALEAALAAMLGLVAGVLAAVASLSLRVVAVGVAAVVTVVWLVALVSVAPTLGPAAEPALVRLGVLDLAALGQGSRATVATVSPPVIALLVGIAVAAAARSIGLPPGRTILSGAAGPALLVLPYLIAPPRGGQGSVQSAAFLGAVIAVAAGLLVAVAVAMVRLPGRGSRGPDPYVSGPLAAAGYGGYVDHGTTGGYGATGYDAAAGYEQAGDDQPGGYGTDAWSSQPVPLDDPDPPSTPDARESPWDDPAPDPSPPGSAGAAPPAGTMPAGSPPEPPEPPEPPAQGAAARPSPAPAPEGTGPAPGTDWFGPTTPPATPPAASPRRRRRQPRNEDEHVDWVRSLGGAENDAPELRTGGRRRLRSDKDVPGDDPDLDPELRLPDPYRRSTGETGDD